MLTNQPQAIDLFSGCGGLTLGLKRGGFDVIGAVDCDANSMWTYKLNHPKVETWETDIRNLSTNEVKRRLKLKKGQLDLLEGCTPCQGFSTLRTMNGNRQTSDHRKELGFNFLEFGKAPRPR